MVPIVNDLPYDYVLVNESPQVHNDEIEEEVQLKNVEEIVNEKGG